MITVILVSRHCLSPLPQKHLPNKTLHKGSWPGKKQKQVMINPCKAVKKKSCKATNEQTHTVRQAKINCFQIMEFFFCPKYFTLSLISERFIFSGYRKQFSSSGTALTLSWSGRTGVTVLVMPSSSDTVSANTWCLYTEMFLGFFCLVVFILWGGVFWWCCWLFCSFVSFLNLSVSRRLEHHTESWSSLITATLKLSYK